MGNIIARVEVRLSDNSELERALRGLRRISDKNSTLKDFRKKEFRIKPAEQRKRDKDAAKKRQQKRQEKTKAIRNAQKLSARINFAKQRKVASMSPTRSKYHTHRD